MSDDRQFEESIRVRRFVVEANHDGWRLDQYLDAKFKRLSRSQVRKVILGGGVELAPPRRRVKAGTRLRTNDEVTIREHLGVEEVQFDEVRVLQREPGFWAFNKPAGMLVHPTATCFRNTLVTYVNERLSQMELGVVHRLDRDTSGVMIMARGRSASARFAERFARHQVDKQYLAVVLDPDARHAPGNSGFNDAPLGYDAASLLPTLKVAHGDWAARTDWRCLTRRGDVALLWVKIEGGRQHQIRAHLSMFGTPIAGDRLYAHSDRFFIDLIEGRADPSVLRAPRQALHAWRLAFEDSGQRFEITAPPPVMFEQLMGSTADQWPLPEG